MLSHWDEPEAPWDRLMLGGHVMPGVWEITSGECARQVDHKKTKNKDGARIQDMGLLPPRMSARGRMVSVGDWKMLQTIMPDIHPKHAGGIKFPLSIFHPAVAVLGVSQVYVERVRPPEIKDGVLEFTIDMIEWTEQPKPTNSKKKVAAPSAYVGTDEDAAILAAQNKNWGLRIAGITLTDQVASTITPDTRAQAEKDAEFAKLTGEDPRHPPEATVVSSINPSTR